MIRELKYVIYGEDRLSDKFKAVSNSQDKAVRGLNQHSDKLKSLRGSYKELGNVMPGVSSGFENVAGFARIALNPVTLLAAGITGIGIAWNKASIESAKFEVEFRKLQNINLDKTSAEIEDLRQQVFGIGMQKGFDPSKVSQGIFDIQSLTGNSGYGTNFTVSNQAEFARAAGADVNKYVSGTGIAMRNFGFGPGELDKFNKSAMGLVATAKITYDQLAEVSAVYAGSAASANQSFDSANKLMAIFTTKTKSAEEAATLTKSAFTELFKKSTVDSFKSIGIDLYDTAGNAKQVDRIMLELNRKFSEKTSARAMDELKNKFQGSEGINALLAAAKDQSGQLLNTLNQFDKGGQGLQKLLSSAKDDINIMADVAENRLKTATVAWGEALLPIKTWIAGIKADLIGSASMMLTKGYWTSGRSATAMWNDKITSAGDLEKWYKSEMEVVSKAKDLSPDEFKVSQDYYRKLYSDAFDIVNKGKGDAVQIEAAKNKMSAVQEVSKALNDAYFAVSPASASSSASGVPGESSSTIKSGIDAISAGGTRNVNVTIQKLIENFTIATTNLQESSALIQAKVEEAMVKAVAGSEQILAN